MEGPEPEHRIYGPRQAVAAFLCYFLATFLAGAVMGVAVLVVAAWGGLDLTDAGAVSAVRSQALPALVLSSTLFGVGTLLAVTRFYLRDLWSEPAATGFRRVSLKTWLGSGLLGGALSGLFQQVTVWLPPSDDFEAGPLVTMSGQSTTGFLCWLVMALLIAPWVEEFLFRGVLFTGLARRWGRWVAALVVSFLFVGLHWGEAGGYPTALLALSCLAAATVVLRIRTESLWPSLACHLCYNGVIAVGTVFP